MSDQGWRALTLGDVATLEYGMALPATTRSGDEFPVFGSNGEVGRHNTALVEGPGIIVGRKGTVGALVWSSTDFWPIDTTYYVEARPGVVKKWLYWAMSVLGLRRLDSSTGVPGLNRNDAYELPLILPSIKEQQRVTEVLDALDDQIGGVKRSIEKLGFVRQGMVTELVERIDQSHQSLRRVAELVVPGQLGSAIGPFGSNLMASDYRASGIPVIFVRDIQSGRFDWKSSVYVSRRKALELNAHRADPGDVLITKMGDPPGVATVHPGEFPSAVITADIIRIRPQEQLTVPEWLALYVNSSHVTRQIRGLAAGVTRQKLTLVDFRGVTVLLPTIQEQLLTVKRVAAIDRLVASGEKELRKLQEAKEGLLADLLRDRLRVPAKSAS